MPAFYVLADVEDDAHKGVIVEPTGDLLCGEFFLRDASFLVH